MDDTAHTQDAMRRRLEPPMNSNISYILNGVGNGAMLAAIPFVAVQVVSEIVQKQLSPSHKRSLMFGSVVVTMIGSVIGARAGLKEAHKIHDYRKSVSDEIRQLRADVDAQANAQAQNGR